MALNWATLDQTRRPIMLPNERIISAFPLTDIAIDIPANSENPTARKLSQSGPLFLTNQRLIFTANPPDSTGNTIDTLSLPLLSILSTSFVQPFFAANHLDLRIKATPEGGLQDGTLVEIRFQDSGLFGFVQSLEKERARVVTEVRERRQGEPLPLYAPPPQSDAPEDDSPPAYQ